SARNLDGAARTAPGTRTGGAPGPGSGTRLGERGPPVAPRASALQLGGQAEERRLVAVRPHQLDGERQAPLRPGGLDLAQGEHDRRLAGEVEPDGEWRERKHAPPVLVYVLHHHVEPPERDRAGGGQGGGEEDVVEPVERGHLPP